MATYRRRAVQGNFYAEAILFRVGADGTAVRAGVQLGRQIKSAKAAMQILDEANNKGYVTQWSDRAQRRYVVADRDNAGCWTSIDPFTGERISLDR